MKAADTTQVLAIVPARGGSQSIPRKNLRPFAGHPLLAYSIAAGQQAKSVDRVIVSTDDQAIADVAMVYGAEVPFLRPANLARNDTPDLPVFQHALEWLAREQSYHPEVVVQLRPTSPLRPLDCVDRAVEALLADSEADSVRGVVRSGQNPYKMWRIEREQLHPLLNDVPEAYNLPRQKLPETYWQTGHIDVIRSTTILETGSMSGERIIPLELDAKYAVDIDTDLDWRRAEQFVGARDLEFVRPGSSARSIPAGIQTLVLDFDGVLTDDRVWVDEDGSETIAAHRGDGYGIAQLRELGVGVIVLSREGNPVVAARCAKLGIEAIQGIAEKGPELTALLKQRRLDPARTVFVGNDVTDLPCFPLVGFSAAVADAHPRVRAEADLILSRPGGHGAVREMCDILIAMRAGKVVRD
jgi:N-acylneuraminate cytidylyltransferase